MQSRKTSSPSSALCSSHVVDALQYCNDILTDAIPACKWVKLACQRHLDDLARVTDPAYPYRFNEDIADMACAFIECLPHVEGVWSTPNIKLEPWQKFIVASLFGWVKKANGKRRFSEGYLCVARKNAKSTIAAAIGLICLLLDGEQGAKILSGATTEKQARFVFDAALSMVRKSPDLTATFGIEAGKSLRPNQFSVPSTSSRFEVLVGNPGDGGNPHLAIVDEYHEHLDSRLYDAMKTGRGARTQPLVLIITTAGFNLSSPCFTLHDDMQKVLSGAWDNPDRFAIIYTIDDGDDWTTEEALRKANPNWGVSVLPENILPEQRNAVQNATYQNTFKTKHLNMWVSAGTTWLNVEKWKAAGDPALKEADFADEPVFMGLDLASKLDMTGVARLYKRYIEGVEHYYVFCRYYLPEAQVDKPTNTHYQRYAKQGNLLTTPGDELDFHQVQRDLVEDIRRGNVESISFDPTQATKLRQDVLAEANCEWIEVPTRGRHMFEPMAELEAALTGGRIHHDGDEVLLWQISNTVLRTNRFGEGYPDKTRPENKIDGVVAMLSALKRAMLHQQRSYECFVL